MDEAEGLRPPANPATLFELILHQLAVSANYKVEPTVEEAVSNTVFMAILSGAVTTKKLMDQTGMSRSTISKHVRLIEIRGSIKVRRYARNGPCRIEILRDY